MAECTIIFVSDWFKMRKILIRFFNKICGLPQSSLSSGVINKTFLPFYVNPLTYDVNAPSEAKLDCRTLHKRTSLRMVDNYIFSATVRNFLQQYSKSQSSKATDSLKSWVSDKFKLNVTTCFLAQFSHKNTLLEINRIVGNKDISFRFIEVTYSVK